MLSKVRGELAAAVALGAALLLAAGYCITWAGLSNEELPTSVILSTLPQSFYLSAAFGALTLPILIAGTFGALLVAHRFESGYPEWKEWILIGAGLVVYARVVVLISDLRFSDLISHDTILWNIVAAIGVLLLTLGLGEITQLRHQKVSRATRLDRVQLGGAVVLVVAIAAASAFKVVDARFAGRVLPYAAAYLDPAKCPPAPDNQIVPGLGSPVLEPPETPATKPSTVPPQGPIRLAQCGVGGFYVGESDQWFYIAQPPSHGGTGRLLFLPRENVQFGAASTRELSLGAPKP